MKSKKFVQTTIPANDSSAEGGLGFWLRTGSGENTYDYVSNCGDHTKGAKSDYHSE